MPPGEIQGTLVLTQVTPQDHETLIRFGISETEEHSWNTENLKKAGIDLLLNELQINPEIFKTRTVIQASVSEPSSTLAGYFLNFASALCKEIHCDSPPANRVLLLNLMPLYMSTSRVDKIIRGLASTGILHDCFGTIIILLRNIDWLLKSTGFSEALASGSLSPTIIGVDIRCYGARVSDDQPIENFEISRAPLQAMLELSENAIYRSLIYETNSYIGHFGLGHSHIRTHYDLTEFIRRDDVWEFLLVKFSALIAGVERVLILGIGMEGAVLIKMGDQLKTLFGENRLVDFTYVNDAQPGTIVQSDWTHNYDMALIVTDIINTGGTVEPLAAELAIKGHGKSVKIFTIVSMQNSPEVVAGIPVSAGVQIRRKYYLADPTECPLCRLKQPLKEVSRESDFCYVAPSQPTPFDFWEMVAEAKALKKQLPDLQGRLFAYRIDTVRLISHYGRWLGNVIRDKYTQAWPGINPDVLCTVAEPTGIAFAKLVARSLEINRVVTVERTDLGRVTSGGGLPEDLNSPFSKGDHVLIVDDGMNYGHTITRLNVFCRAAGSVPMGAMVMDSRLDDKQVQKIRSQMARAKLVYLYSWPAGTTNL